VEKRWGRHVDPVREPDIMAVAAVGGVVRPQARSLCSAARAALGPQRLRLTLGAHCVPKSIDGPGEDAFFASHPLAAFGLADGVGSWSRVGIDAGLFSRTLLRHAHREMQRRAVGTPRLPNLPETVRLAFEAVREEQVLGSCTLLLAQMHMNMLSVLNFGDSGIVAFRPFLVQSKFVGGTPEPALRIIYRSTPMLHRPNLPLQLSHQDASDMSVLEPYDLVTLRVRPGDIIVAGTDGLFDNVGERELKSLVLPHSDLYAKQRDSRERASDLADRIAQRAAEIARSPYEFGGGGKLDDIAVVVGHVGETSHTVSGSLMDNFAVDGGTQPAAESAA